MRIRDIMSRPVYTVEATDTVEYAAALLADRKITAAPVVAAGDRLVGMVSEGDLLRHRVPHDPVTHAGVDISRVEDRRPRLVRDVMSAPVVTVRAEADLADVAELLLNQDVRSVPVLDDGQVVGIVSRRDILRTVVRSDDVLAFQAQHRLDEYAGDTRRWSVTVTDGVASIDGDFVDEPERAMVTILARTVPGVSAVRVAEHTA